MPGIGIGIATPFQDEGLGGGGGTPYVPPVATFELREDGSFVLREDGFKIIRG